MSVKKRRALALQLAAETWKGRDPVWRDPATAVVVTAVRFEKYLKDGSTS